ncbi:B3/B4 domain-containing protein [Vagococcus silagei]|uniref:B3/B4 tRNA-binding domain-containing protein n=1 Tax=Vagococcus silagei TaxID=2508885 RepID=A0A4S3B4L5_9ENTE|nr:phenylalanine--tRNA ligase beta subunit-related protein [Vagococcus silagei]THB60346.1 hypothetical protein ESZ54_10880 [Vagococcus silagei]
MDYKLDDSLKTLGIDTIVVATVHGLDTLAALPEQLETELQQIEAAVLKQSLESLEDNQVVQGYYEMIQKIKRSKKKYPPTVEALIKNVQRRESLPRINSVVDLYNLEALTSYFSIGAHDLRKITFPIEFTVSGREDVFHPIMSSEKKVMPFDYLYRDQNGVLAYLDCRDSEDYKLDEQTTDAIFVIQGNEYTSTESRVEALERFIKKLQVMTPEITYQIEIIT